MNLRSLNSAQVKVHCMHLRYHWVLARSKFHSINLRLGFNQVKFHSINLNAFVPSALSIFKAKLLFELHISHCENSTPWIRSLCFLYVMNFGVTPFSNPKIYMWFCRVWFSWPCHLVNVNFLTLSTSLNLACLKSNWVWTVMFSMSVSKMAKFQGCFGGQMLSRRNKLQQILSWPNSMTWNLWTEMWPSEPVPKFLHPPPKKNPNNYKKTLNRH